MKLSKVQAALAAANKKEDPPPKMSFLEKMGQIGGKGKLSPRSQRLLGGLSGAKYSDIKADYVPSEKAKNEAFARAQKAESERLRRLEAGEDSAEEQDDDEEAELSPTTILRRAKRTSSACQTTMAQAQEALAASSKLIASQFKGMSESKLRARIKITFDTYDVSGDGLLQVEELHGALTGLGQTVTMEEAAEFVRVNAMDGTPDELTFGDFERVIRKMLFGDEAGISRVVSGEEPSAEASSAEVGRTASVARTASDSSGKRTGSSSSGASRPSTTAAARGDPKAPVNAFDKPHDRL